MKDFDTDKAFTDKMHAIALTKIYPQLNYIIDGTRSAELYKLKDMQEGVDYIAVDENGNEIYIQERFRRYSENSFTLRYRRETSKNEREQFSEFFKIKQVINNNHCQKFIMLYGISSLDETDVACFITIDLQMFFMNFLDGKIAVDLNQRNNSVIRDGIIYGATFQNQDNSSIMTYFDCSQIYELFPEMILYNKGFLLTENDKKNQPTTGQRLLIQQLIKKHTASLDLLTEEEAWVLIDCLKKNNEDLITLLKSNNFRLNPVVPYEVNPDKVIGSKPRTTFHRIGCTYEPKTKEKRIVFENIQSAIDAGFKPCNHCKPLVKAVDIE